MAPNAPTLFRVLSCTVLYCENFCSYNYFTSLPHLIIVVYLCVILLSGIVWLKEGET